MTSKERSILKGKAHHFRSKVIIGKKGLNSGTLKNIDLTLESQGLIKIKFIEFKHDKKNILKKIEQLSKSILISITGNIAILYRKK